MRKRFTLLSLLLFSSLVLAAPVSATTQKFIYVYNGQGQLLTLLNAVDQCPDPGGR